jgi:hypothetical protein
LDFNLFVAAPLLEYRGCKFRAIIHPKEAGIPLSAVTFSNTRMIRRADREVSISMARASREQSSITLKVRNFRFPTMLSLMKSILQLALVFCCCCKGCFTLAGSRRLPFLRLFNFKSL